MKHASYRRLAAPALALALIGTGCGAADNDVDPRHLGVRDLLGVSPTVAAAWSPAQRASARQVLADALAAQGDADHTRVPLGLGAGTRDAVLASLAAIDHGRHELGEDPLLVIRARLADPDVVIAPRATAPIAPVEPARDDDPPLVAIGWERGHAQGWDHLLRRGTPLLARLAREAGHGDGPLRVAPAASEPFVAVYVADDALLLVNPVALAALEPVAGEHAITPGAAPVFGPAGDPSIGLDPADRAAHSGNPYSFYGSVNECAAAQRSRCEACLAAGDCRPRSDSSDGAYECQILGADDGIGYYLFCVNLALAIHSVASCTASARPGCSQSAVGHQLEALYANQNFLDDPACAAGLDGCLAEIYGEPGGYFPSPDGPDAGPGDDPTPPRPVDVSCGESSVNCDFSPECDTSCDSPSCGDSLSCGDCGGCDSGGCGSSGGGGGGGGGGGCDSDSDCSGCDSDCGGCDSDGCDSSCDDGCGGGGCGGGDCGGGDCGGDCGGGGGDCGNCNVNRPARPSHGAVMALALLWALAPLPVFELWRRRERRSRESEHPDNTQGGER